MTVRTHARRGFSLIELIVVLSIIGLLAALTAGAVGRYRQSSMQTNTEVMLRKIQVGVDQQWKAAIDKIKSEDPPQYIKDLTRNADGSFDPRRAKALHLKLRLRQEFPQTFVDLRAAVPDPAYTPKSVYLATIKDATGNAELEGAALAFLILSQGRGGTTFDADAIGPTQILDFGRIAPAVGTIPLRVFIDAYGMPISFRRLADDDRPDILEELNAPPFVSPEQFASPFRDPQDPEGRLKLNWPGKALALSYLSYPNPNLRPYIVNPFDGSNRGPYVFSAGKDKIYNNENDLLSFRLQQTGRGN